MQTATSAVPVSASSERRADGGVLTQGEEKSKTLRRAPRHQSSPFRVLISVLWVLFLAPLTSYAQAKYPFDLPAQPLAESLRAVGHQTSTNVMFEPRLVKGLDAPALRTETTPTEAIRLLLAGTELTALQTAASTVLIQRVSTSEKSAPTSQAVAPNGTNGYTRLAQAETDPSAQDERESSNSEGDNSSLGSAQPEMNRIVLEEIVVTGTNIRGVYPSSSPLEIYTAEDIARTGATTTEQFIAKLPQNLGTRTQYASNATGTLNRESVNSVDLRGLGVGTTLVLLNGRRLGLGANGRAMDISLIPVSAIKRVEVLTDGASAIYGTDAIGGVVNFIPRDDFDGAETRLSYGGVTSGDLRQGGFTQTFGGEWSSGHALISYDFFDASPLETADRDFAAPAGPGYLAPDDRRHGSLATISQELGDRLTVNSDLMYSRREIKSLTSVLGSSNPLNHARFTRDSETQEYFANLGAELSITDSLSGSLLATYSEADVDTLEDIDFFNRGTVQRRRADTNHSATDLTATLNGSLFALPAGDLRFSLGGGFLDEDYRAAMAIGGALSGRQLGRTTTYAFGELFAPLVGEEQDLPLLHRLELSLAARYTSYSDASEPSLGRDFGDNTSPKVGITWAPAPFFDLRASYGKSFRAPSLTEIDPTSATNNLLPGFPIAGVSSTVLQVAGPSPQLEPETAESYTVGFDLHRTSRPSFRLSATYFNIAYEGRISQGDFLAGFANPANAPDSVYRPSSVDQIEQLLRSTTSVLNLTGINLTDPHAAAIALAALPNFWVVDLRFRNLAVSEVDGIDLAIGDRFETPWGPLSVGGQVTRVFDYRQQNTPTSPVLTVVDTVLRPVGLRGRLYGSLTRGGFEGTLSANYVDDYENPFAAGGAADVESWTTFDLSVSYGFSQDSNRLLDGVRLSFSAQNIFDKDPPSVAGSGAGGPALQLPVGFDPANANPLGRFVMITLTKRW